MNWSPVWLLIKHEFRMLLRDRRTVVLAFVLPLLITPILLSGLKISSEWRRDRQDETTYLYMVTGDNAGVVRTLIDQGRADRIRNEPDPNSRRFSFMEATVPEPDSALASGLIHFIMATTTGSSADSIHRAELKESLNNDDEAIPDKIRTARIAGVPVVTLIYMGNRDGSRTGMARMVDLLAGVRASDRFNRLRSSGMQIDPEKVMAVESQDLATVEQAAGAVFGKFLPLFLIILTISGASVVAMDSITGEKERGSLETLLTTAVSRVDIVTAKQVTILLVALGIVIMQTVNLLVYITFGLLDLPDHIMGALPLKAVITLFILYLPVAVVISSLLLMISAYAKSYKETQLYYFPLFIGLSILASAAFLPAVTLESFIVMIPIANVAVAVREVMVGTYNWLMLSVTTIVMLAAAYYLLRVSTGMLSMERLITSQDLDRADVEGGQALFQKRVLWWFTGIWVLILVVPANIPALATLQGQLFFNMFCVMLGMSLLMIRVYKLNWRTALAVRPVKPVVWPVIILLIPVTQIVGTGVFALANKIFPFPVELLEEFAATLAPTEYPLWQILIMLAVVPGIVEEVAFRGLLLHGLHRRLRPVVLILVVGGLFGLFHTSLFRIIPTAYIGVVITGIAMMTGSIFPCMLMHAGNNALALTLYHYGISMDEIGTNYYIVSCMVFMVLLTVLYKNRTPYPGLLPLKKGRPPADNLINGNKDRSTEILPPS